MRRGNITKQIPIIDDEAEVGESLVKLFASEGVDCAGIANPSSACFPLAANPGIPAFEDREAGIARFGAGTENGDSRRVP